MPISTAAIVVEAVDQAGSRAGHPGARRRATGPARDPPYRLANECERTCERMRDGLANECEILRARANDWGPQDDGGPRAGGARSGDSLTHADIDCRNRRGGSRS